jgi:hypothetical protein
MALQLVEVEAFRFDSKLSGTRNNMEESGKSTVLIDIGKRSPAVPVTPPYMRVRIRRFGGLSD